MKKIIFIAAIALLLTGCGVLWTPTASYIANRSYIGMSVAEFKKLTNGNFGVETMTPEYTVYRSNEWSGSTEHRYISSAKFFHFNSKGKLVRIESRDFAPPFFPGRHNLEYLNP